MRNYPKKPIIGLSPQVDYETGEYKIAFPYTDCLLKAGAIPMLLPFTENEEEIADLIGMCDGIVLTGGGVLSGMDQLLADVMGLRARVAANADTAAAEGAALALERLGK